MELVADAHLLQPLKTDAAGEPLLYLALGIYLQLESLEEEDVDRLRAVGNFVHGWLGDRLRHAGTSALQSMREYRPTDLELMAGQAAQMEVIRELRADSNLDSDEKIRVADPYDNFELAIHGGTLSEEPSPYDVRFFSRLLEDDEGPTGESASMLRICVPQTWPLDDFYRRVVELAGMLRLRWGAAGYMATGWEKYRRSDTHNALRAVARRFPGLDVGYYDNSTADWHDALRTVNWLTWVGPALAARVPVESLAPGVLIRIDTSQPTWLIQAGDAPVLGDINRLDLPRAYVEVDRALLPIRAAATEISFSDPWDELTTERWLRRFEQSVH